MCAAFTVTGGQVLLDLPPKSPPPPPQSAAAIGDALTSVIAYHPQALTTYTFYEVLDEWLELGGERGYPIAYGKYYNILFTTNGTLMANPEARRWIENTTVCLQTALRDFVLQRVQAGTLGNLTEGQLRQAAFDSHARCYTDGGLARVVLLDPFMVPIIATIPAKEFLPTAENFGPTVRQVFETMAAVVPLAAGLTVAAAMPAHSGMLRRAAAMDARHYRDTMTFPQRMGNITAAIRRGELDHIPLLDDVVTQLNRAEYRDPGQMRMVREVIQAARARRSQLRLRYEQTFMNAPREVRDAARSRYPDAFSERPLVH